MSRLIETVQGGLITARDPAQLAPGELQFLQNAVYDPGSQALRRATGRTQFGAANANASAINGLRDPVFLNGDHLLLALWGSALSTATLGDTGTFALATTLSTSAATALDAVQANDEWYLFTGVDRLAMYVSATAAGTPVSFRPHGLVPVSGSISASATAGTFSASATGYFEYWTTEVFDYTRDGAAAQLESTYTGATTNFFVATTASAVRVVRPPTANANATRWRLYRNSAPNTSVADRNFPTGFFVSEAPMSATAMIDGVGQGGGYFFGNATATGFGGVPAPLFPYSSATAFEASWITAERVTAQDATNASATATIRDHVTLGGGVLLPTGLPPFARFFVNGTNVTGLTDPITGVEVAVGGSVNATGTSLGVRFHRLVAGSIYSSVQKTVPLVSGANVDYIVGGNGDVWGAGTASAYGPNLLSSDFASANFALSVLFTSENMQAAATALVDYVKLKIYGGGTAGTTIATDTPFPALNIDIAGTTLGHVGSHGQPPIATTADFFQGSLVTNDIATPNLTRHSLPLAYDYFPSIYFIDYNMGHGERVTNIKRLNNRLAVMTTQRLFRVNYLPTEADSNFQSGGGPAFEEVNPDVGCVNAMCACTYTGAARRTELAFVSNIGIHTTDLFTVNLLTNDLDWRLIMATAATANARPIALVNDQEQRELLFYYRNDSLGQERYKCLHLFYDQTHVTREGGLKLGGQVNMRNYASGAGVSADLYSAWSVTRAAGNVNVYLGYGGAGLVATAAGAGFVYRETGNVLPAFDPTMQYTLRRMYLAGAGGEFQMGEVYTYNVLSDTTSTQDWNCTPSTTKTNFAGAIAQTTKNHVWGGEVQWKHQFNLLAESVDLAFAQGTASANNSWSVQHHIIDGQNFGEEDSGR